jgi:hypothetical protein
MSATLAKCKSRTCKMCGFSVQPCARNPPQYYVVRTHRTHTVIANAAMPEQFFQPQGSPKPMNANQARTPQAMQSKIFLPEQNLPPKHFCQCDQSNPKANATLRSHSRNRQPSKTASDSPANPPNCAALLPRPRRDRDYRLVDPD